MAWYGHFVDGVAARDRCRRANRRRTAARGLPECHESPRRPGATDRQGTSGSHREAVRSGSLGDGCQPRHRRRSLGSTPGACRSRGVVPSRPRHSRKTTGTRPSRGGRQPDDDRLSVGGHRPIRRCVPAVPPGTFHSRQDQGARPSRDGTRPREDASAQDGAGQDRRSRNLPRTGTGNPGTERSSGAARTADSGRS